MNTDNKPLTPKESFEEMFKNDPNIKIVWGRKNINALMLEKGMLTQEQIDELNAMRNKKA